ncbi:hypothetical protein AA0488_0107 [Kozakia baliensis NRIC 0488]|uniref:Uncharacterized protein n=2 Tax=Kozakia baliensis TaxID=153496 RepID=A0A1D8UWV8_9PROT|nr:hypothetical protein A0U89_13520 [Kozakia baliensis]GBR23327.1 hypothetical protein AA0488_0107 [Kozakia baliensis NRIC 0488]GEL65797.1 hypothetical protein KBA01_30830 [Kozakia baliensis]
MTVHEFGTDHINVDPEKGAEQMMRLFAAKAEEMALDRAQYFMKEDDIERARFWLEVRAYLREMEIRCRSETVH